MTAINHIRTKFGDLAAEVKTTYHVSWLGWGFQPGLDKIFEAAYGKPMEMLESPNDTDYSMDIKKEVFDDYNQKDVDKCIAQGSFENYYLRWLMTDLVNKDVLPAGHYVITMSW